MDTFKRIRERLGWTQAEMAAVLDVSQGTISFYENGKTVPPQVARKLIDVARQRGLDVTFDHVYGDEALPIVNDKPTKPERAQASTKPSDKPSIYTERNAAAVDALRQSAGAGENTRKP